MRSQVDLVSERPELLVEYRIVIRISKKQAKHRKRKKEKQDKQVASMLAERKRKKRELYPSICVDAKVCDPKFLEVVMPAIRKLDFEDTRAFTSADRQQLKLVTKLHQRSCIDSAKRRFGLTENEYCRVLSPWAQSLADSIGSVLMNLIPETDRFRFSPYSHLQVICGTGVIIRLSSMLSRSGSGGTVFYSRLKPSVEFDGKTFTVGYSRHSIERLCERHWPNKVRRYGVFENEHRVLNRCIYHEPLILHGNQPAFALYAEACESSGERVGTYVNEILGESMVVRGQSRFQLKVGYCPVVFEGGFAKAKTFLFPGYAGTPEYGLVQQSDLSWPEKKLIIEQMAKVNFLEIIESDKRQIIKWFHINGIPQVIPAKREIFESYTPPSLYRRLGNSIFCSP